jgi:hypothetical protein
MYLPAVGIDVPFAELDEDVVFADSAGSKGGDSD